MDNEIGLWVKWKCFPLQFHTAGLDGIEIYHSQIKSIKSYICFKINDRIQEDALINFPQ